MVNLEQFALHIIVGLPAPLAPFEIPWGLGVIHRPKAAAVALGVFLRCEIFIFPLERPTLDHPSPTIHYHLEFDIACSRAGGCNRAGVARPIQIIVDCTDPHLLGQEAHTQQPLVRIDREASG